MHPVLAKRLSRTPTHRMAEYIGYAALYILRPAFIIIINFIEAK
jgi:hypothetical protein